MSQHLITEIYDFQNNETDSMLNPKLVTHRRGSIGRSYEPVSRPTPPPPAPAPAPTSIDLKKRLQTRDTPVALAPGRFIDTPSQEQEQQQQQQGPPTNHSNHSSRRASIPTHSNRSSRLPSARRYEHVHSVVKDLIENKITPLEAQYGNPVQRQRSQSSNSVVTYRSSLPRGYTRGDSPVTPRRNISSARYINNFAESRTSMTSTPLPHEFITRGSSGLNDTLNTRATRLNNWRSIDSPNSRQLSQYAYVSQVVENLNSARVPSNHVPRCAKEIPERYKYHPPPPQEQTEITETETSTTENKKEKYRRISRGRSIASRTNSNTMIGMNFNTKRTASASGFSRQHTTGSNRSGINRENNNNKGISTPASVPFGGNSMMSSLRTEIKGKINSLNSKSSFWAPETSRMKTVKEEKSKMPKPLKGIDRVLLFETAPPNIFT